MSVAYGSVVRASYDKHKVWCSTLGSYNLEFHFEKFQKPPVHGLSGFFRFVRVIRFPAVLDYSPGLALDRTVGLSGSVRF